MIYDFGTVDVYRIFLSVFVIGPHQVQVNLIYGHPVGYRIHTVCVCGWKFSHTKKQRYMYGENQR